MSNKLNIFSLDLYYVEGIQEVAAHSNGVVLIFITTKFFVRLTNALLLFPFFPPLTLPLLRI